MLEGVNVSNAFGLTQLVSTDEDQVIYYQRFAMEAHLSAILADVVAPLQLTCSFVKSVEVAGTRTDEE